MFTPTQPIKLVPLDDSDNPLEFPNTGNPDLRPDNVARSWSELRDSSRKIELVTTRITRGNTTRDVHVLTPKTPSRGFGVGHADQSHMIKELQAILALSPMHHSALGPTFDEAFADEALMAEDGTVAWWALNVGVIWTLSLEAAQLIQDDLTTSVPARWRWVGRFRTATALHVHRPA